MAMVGYTNRIFCMHDYTCLANLILIMGYEVSLRPASLLTAFSKRGFTRGRLVPIVGFLYAYPHCLS